MYFKKYKMSSNHIQITDSNQNKEEEHNPISTKRDSSDSEQLETINPKATQSQNQTEENKEKLTQKYGETGYRWYVMISYFTLTFAISICMYT